MMNRLISSGLGLVLTFADASAFAQSSVKDIPAEEQRLSPALFREGLKKRGLIDLLELHLKEFPPASPSAATLMNREVKLAEFADPSRPLEERRAAIAEANRQLEQLISENADDPRAMEWRMTLAHSLLYQEGESHALNMLYFGGTDADRRALAPIAARALAVMRDLIRQIDAENSRVDALSAREFERLEETGAISNLDKLGPAADYLLLWALFYDALPRDKKDPLYGQQLGEISKTFIDNPQWLTIPQEKSQVQIPALLLAGMTKRRLGDFISARQHLERASAAGEKLDASEKDGVQWALTLAALEAGRNAAEEGRFDAALDEVAALRSMPAIKAPAQYGARLAAALLERSILLARADSADKAGRSTDARKHREDAWRSLATLAAEEPQNRALLYATLFRTMKSQGNVAVPKDPLEMAAWMAGMLDEAAKDEQRKDELLNRALSEAEQYLAQASGAQRMVTPEILFQMGVALHRLGRQFQAAEKMLEIARRHPNYGQAGEAAVLAVQLCAQLCLDPSNCEAGSSNQQLYRQALETLLSGYTNLEASKYWRFYYGQLLEDVQEFAAAAQEYAHVERGHEHYVEAAFRRVRACARAAAQSVSREPPATSDALTHVNEAATAYRDLITRVTAESFGKEPQRAQLFQDLVAQARLWLAETYLLKGINRPDQAFDLLAGFEDSFGRQSPHLGRLWQARLRALEASGKLEEATQAVPEYIAADARNAGPALQLLYDAMMAEWRKQSTASAPQPFPSDIMLLLAGQIVKWSERPDVAASTVLRRQAAIQNAEAHLLAGRYPQARDLFATLLPKESIEVGALGTDEHKTILGYARALLGAGEPEAALPHFNRLATGLSPENSIRWQALLGDLECRTALGHPPEGILKVIAQQRRLFPDMGGQQISASFDRIERENVRRRDQRE